MEPMGPPTAQPHQLPHPLPPSALPLPAHRCPTCLAAPLPVAPTPSSPPRQSVWRPWGRRSPLKGRRSVSGRRSMFGLVAGARRVAGARGDSWAAWGRRSALACRVRVVAGALGLPGAHAAHGVVEAHWVAIAHVIGGAHGVAGARARRDGCPRPCGWGGRQGARRSEAAEVVWPNIGRPRLGRRRRSAGNGIRPPPSVWRRGVSAARPSAQRRSRAADMGCTRWGGRRRVAELGILRGRRRARRSL